MDYVIAKMGIDITLGLISGLTSMTNGICTLLNRISYTGSNDVKKIINENDMLMSIKVIQCMISEIKINEDTPVTLVVCLKGIFDVINDIRVELEKINYRLQYNNNLWVARSFRSYRFDNCCTRLKNHINILSNRKKILIDTLSIVDKMYKNKNLENKLSQSTLSIDVNNLDHIILTKNAITNNQSLS